MATGHFSLKILGCDPMKDFSESRDDAKLYNFYLSESALKDKQLTYLAKKYLVDIVKTALCLSGSRRRQDALKRSLLRLNSPNPLSTRSASCWRSIMVSRKRSLTSSSTTTSNTAWAKN